MIQFKEIKHEIEKITKNHIFDYFYNHEKINTKNEVIRLIAPSSYISVKKLKTSINRLKEFKFNYIYRKDVIEKEVYFAGTLNRRVKEFNEAFISNNKNIFSIKGGYASMELLNYLNWEEILKQNKTFMGFSDITSLLIGLYSKGYQGRLIHGPNIGGNSWKGTFLHKKDFFLDCISGKDYYFKLEKEIKYKNLNDFEGEIIGGNLRIITHMIGTEFEPNFSNKVVFLEDVREKPAAIYTMLLYLQMTNKLKHIKALLIGKMNNCGEYIELLELFFKRLNIPIIYELPLGHAGYMYPIRYGDLVKFDSKKKQLYFSETKI